MCEEQFEEMTQEEFEIDAEANKAKGPYSVQRETRHWKDFMKRNRQKDFFVVRDASGVQAAKTESELSAYRWALELTTSGFIEE